MRHAERARPRPDRHHPPAAVRPRGPRRARGGRLRIVGGGRLRARRAARPPLGRHRHRHAGAMAGRAAGVRGAGPSHARDGDGARHAHGDRGRAGARDHDVSQRRRLRRRAPPEAGVLRAHHRRGSRTARLHHERPGLPPRARPVRPLRRPRRPRSARDPRRGRPRAPLLGRCPAHAARLPVRRGAGVRHRPGHLRRHAGEQGLLPASPPSASPTSCSDCCWERTREARSSPPSTCWRPCCPSSWP